MDVEEDQVGNQCHMIATIERRKSPALVAEVCVNGSWISMGGTYRHYLHSVKFKKSRASLRAYSAEPLVFLEKVYVQVLYKGKLLALRLM